MRERFVYVTVLCLACGAPPAPAPSPEPALPVAATTGAEESQPAGELSEVAARHQIIAYYADVGEWAGQYAISQIETTRFDVAGPDVVEVHTRYYYRCLLDRCAGAPEGHDQRIFTFERDANGWRIVRMGEHMSATF